MNCIVDGHCDTLSKVLDDNSILINSNYSFNYTDAKLFRPYIQMMAAYVDPKYLNEDKGGFNRANRILDVFYENEKDKEIVNILNRDDLKKTIDKNKVGVILTIENGSAISGNINNIDHFYNKGVRVMGITWNEDNDLASGALTKDDKGLTLLGREYIKKLAERNIIIDVSHASEKTFWDVAKETDKAFVATHSCVYSICRHKRNLKDEQIKEIAKRGGIVGICFVSKFLNEKGVASREDIIKHVKYVRDLVGIDYVGLGSDFDGVDLEGMPMDLKRIEDLEELKNDMEIEGFSEKEINKFFGENWIRVLNNML